MRNFCFICLIINALYVNAQSFYDIQTVKDIRLSFEKKDWDAFMDSVKKNNGETRLIGDLTIDGQSFPKVGVRYKGNSSYFNVRHSNLSKLPLNIKVSETDKKALIFNKYHTMKLSNVFRDPSFIREALSYEIIRKYMPAPEANFAKVTVNNQLLGIYSNTESLDGNFIKNHFNTDKGWWVKCDPEWNAKEVANCQKGDKSSLMYLGEDSSCYKNVYEVNDGGSWKEWLDFIRILNQEPDKIEKYLNVDQTLWMMAFNNILVNLDSYLGRLSHNFYMYRGVDGRFTPVVWDLNLSFGGFGLDGQNPAPLSLEAMQTMSPFLHADNPKRPLFSQLMQKETYRKMYIHHCKTILKDWFYNDEYLRRANSMMQTIDYQVKSDKNKLYSYESFQQNLNQTVSIGTVQIVGIKELMQKRVEFFKNHPAFKKDAPTIQNPVTGTVEDKKSIKITVKGANRVFFCVRNDINSAYRYLPMFDDGKHDDGAAGDGVFGTVFLAKAGMQYYILAENDDSIGLLPERAGFEFLELK
jgi:CotH kinase protein